MIKNLYNSSSDTYNKNEWCLATVLYEYRIVSIECQSLSPLNIKLAFIDLELPIEGYL